jgi:methylthioribose-1-phosphate isomerase
MKVADRHYRSIWADEALDSVHIIDQSRLPHTFATLRLDSHEAVAEAIESMRVRGAPLIGVAGAFGMALAASHDASDEAMSDAFRRLQATRPTAVNLSWALSRMRDVLRPLTPVKRADRAWQEALTMAEEDVALNEGIGRQGLAILQREHEDRGRTVNVLTHCNAGWLATVDWGTVTAPIFMAHDMGIPVHVWVDETRPRNQGLLTAWELAGHGVPHTLIADSAGGHLMQHGHVDLVIVGADRVTRRGDVCNKVGTYLKALAARDNAVPFYACVPTPTIDWTIEDGIEEIEIEERSGDEVREVRGLDADGKPSSVRIAGGSTKVANPAFDVTPHDLVTGIITERAVVRAAERELETIRPASTRQPAPAA